MHLNVFSAQDKGRETIFIVIDYMARSLMALNVLLFSLFILEQTKIHFNHCFGLCIDYHIPKSYDRVEANTNNTVYLVYPDTSLSNINIININYVYGLKLVMNV